MELHFKQTSETSKSKMLSRLQLHLPVKIIYNTVLAALFSLYKDAKPATQINSAPSIAA